MRTAIDSQAMADWGWRIPFLIGGALGFFALYLRRGLEESAAFADQAASTGTPSSARSALRDIWAQRTSILRVVLLVGGTSVFSYTWSVNAPAYAISFHHVNDKLAMWAGVVANIVFILALPLAALLADRFGRRPNNIAWGLLVALLAFPLSGMLDGSALTLVVAMSLALVIQRSRPVHRSPGSPNCSPRSPAPQVRESRCRSRLRSSEVPRRTSIRG